MTNEERIRASFAAFNERGLAADTTDIWHPDIDYHEAPDFPGAGSYHGRDAVRARFAEYIEALGTARAEIEEVVARGDRVAWTVRLTGRSPEGVPNAHTWGYVGRFEDGMLAECHAYYNAADALAAL